MIDATGRTIALAVDGGIDPGHRAQRSQAGADTLIAGTAVFGATGLRGGDRRVCAPPDDAEHPDERHRRAAATWLRDLRRLMARLPRPSMSRVPDAPIQPMRDVWPGDPMRGARLLRGEIELGGATATPATREAGRPMRRPRPC